MVDNGLKSYIAFDRIAIVTKKTPTRGRAIQHIKLLNYDSEINKSF